LFSSRQKKILRLALPIMGAMASQNIMNVVDSAMVGTQGSAALDAVGMSSMLVFLASAALMGLSEGVQAMAARRLGAGKIATMAMPLNGGLLLAIVIGVPLSLALYMAAPKLYPYLRSDPAVIAEGIPYLRARLIAVTAVGMNFSFRGYFNGVNKSHVYMRSLLIMHACNVVISYVLIFGKLGFPAMGATGAGVGTAMATGIATVIYFFMASSQSRAAGFMRGLPSREMIRTTLQVALPSMVRTAFFAGGLTMLYWIVGQVSTHAGAAAQLVVTLMLVAILPGIGLGMAAASLVGQALGRNEPEDALRWGWDVVKIAVVVLAVLGLPMLLIPDQLLGFFIDDAATIAEGSMPLRVVGATIFIDGIGLVLQNAMLGAGDSRRIMIVAVALQWVVFLPAAYAFGPLWGFGMLGIWLAQAGHRAIQAGAFAFMWHRGRWANASV
jgi:MATE family multidrug resistance protein